MTTYAVEFADEAWAAIDSHVRYVAVQQQTPERAGPWLARLLAAVDKLQHMPRRHVVDPRQSQIHGVEVHRLIFERRYLAFYSVDDVACRVTVVSFRHTAQQPP